MIHKNYGSITMTCDNCSTELDGIFMSDELHQIFDAAKISGWKLNQALGGLEHYCPFCDVK